MHPWLGWVVEDTCSPPLSQHGEFKEASSTTSRVFAGFSDEVWAVFLVCSRQAHGDVGVVPS